MGFGDNIMATGLARGAAAGGRRIAFGDGKRIIWDHNSPVIFRGNANIAPPGSEHRHDIQWVDFYKGHRVYNHHDEAAKRWVWNMDFRPTPGEIFLDPAEKALGGAIGEKFVLIEPFVVARKPAGLNKDWGRVKYQQVANRLMADGHQLVQLSYGAGAPLSGVRIVTTRSFREAVAVLSRAGLYLGPEGGLHHAAAAFGIPGVVIFGGFVPPQVTGYEIHRNLTGGAEACGSLYPCRHCRAALTAITVDEVYSAASEILNGYDAADRRAV